MWLFFIKEISEKKIPETLENKIQNFREVPQIGEVFSPKEIKTSDGRRIPEIRDNPIKYNEELLNESSSEKEIPMYKMVSENYEKKETPLKIEDIEMSSEEKEIYENTNLEKGEINGKECLKRTDIDYDQKDESTGLTNKERMGKGLAPLDKNGKPIELHHIGQKENSPLAELTQEEHRGKGNDTVLHDKKADSEIDRNKFNKEK